MMALNITMIVVWIAYVIASLIAGNTKAIGYAIIGMVLPLLTGIVLIDLLKILK